MSQFGLGSANSHWGYSSASYSPYLTSGGLSTCGTTSAAQFNNPALGFSCSATDQTSTQDFTNNTRECLPSKFDFKRTKQKKNHLRAATNVNLPQMRC